MKIDVYSMEGKKKGKVDLPSPFEEEVRPIMIRKAVTACQANRRQPYGPSKEAGMRHATSSPDKGGGVARVQRLTQYGNTAAESPNNVGGRRAHPPKPEKDLGKKINKKEKKKARRSALAATSDGDLVRKRGHIVDGEDLVFPIVLEKGIQEISQTSEAIELLEKIGVYSDIQRAHDGRNIRAGKGKARDRKHRKPVSLLVVLPKDSDGIKAFSNLPGVTVKTPDRVTVEDLAPGGDIGRLTLFSVQSLNGMEDW